MQFFLKVVIIGHFLKPSDNYMSQNAAKTLSHQIYEVLDESKGEDINILYVADQTIITDYMIVVTGTSSRHLKALTDKIRFYCKDHNIEVRSIEGESNAQWVLVDLNEIMVHIMLASTREYYEIEKLWSMDVELGDICESKS